MSVRVKCPAWLMFCSKEVKLHIAIKIRDSVGLGKQEDALDFLEDVFKPLWDGLSYRDQQKWLQDPCAAFLVVDAPEYVSELACHHFLGWGVLQSIIAHYTYIMGIRIQAYLPLTPAFFSANEIYTRYQLIFHVAVTYHHDGIPTDTEILRLIDQHYPGERDFDVEPFDDENEEHALVSNFVSGPHFVKCDPVTYGTKGKEAFEKSVLHMREWLQTFNTA